MPTASVEMGEEAVGSLERFGVLAVQRLGEDADIAKRLQRGGVG